MVTRWVRVDGQGVRCRLTTTEWRYSSVPTVQRDIDNLGKVIAQLERRLANERADLATLLEVRTRVAQVRQSVGYLRKADHWLLPGGGEKPPDGPPSADESRKRNLRRLEPGEVRRRSDTRNGG